MAATSAANQAANQAAGASQGRQMRRLRSDVSAEVLQQLQKKANRLSNIRRFWALGRIAHHHFPEYTQKVFDPAEPPKVFGFKWLLGGHQDASGSAPLLKMVVYAAKALSYMGLLSSNHSRIVDEL